jgi:ankyrin repeat protein
MTWTTLHDACERQDTAEILVRTKVHPEEAVREDDRGATPLHIACWTNPPLSVVEALIQAFPGAIQDQDVHGDTPLHVALTNPETNPDVIRALLEACPSAASIANKEGLYPLHKACRYGATEQVVNALLEAYPEALRTHIKMGYPVPRRKSSAEKRDDVHPVVDPTRRLSGTMANLNFADAGNQIRDGAYPLHMAVASKCSPVVVEMIMKEAPDVLTMTNKFGETPLHLAFLSDANEEIVELLLHEKDDLGALAIAENVNGNLPLHLAAIHGCCESVAVLLMTEYGGAVKVKNKEGKTPLDLAREYKQCSDDVIRLLEREIASPRNTMETASTLQWPDDQTAE